MEISANSVKELREITGAGLMDCKKTLAETNGDMEKAVDLLREKGLAKAAKKSDRIAAEGIVDLTISSDFKTGMIIEVNSETDFVAKNSDFIDFVSNISKSTIDKKPKDLQTLLTLDYLNEGKSIEEALKDKIAVIGEKLDIRRIAIEESDNGGVFGYIHGNKIAVLVNIESSAKAEDLQDLGKDIAMQVASMNPKYISRDDVDAEYITHEKEVLMNQALNEAEEEKKDGKKAKPIEIIEKMVEGRLQKELKEVCLLEQAFIKDGDISVKQLVENTAKKIGSDIKIKSIIRYEVGEGIEKKVEDFQAEVAKQIKG